MTYRFATVAFFGAYALADDDPVLDWGILKGIVLRNLRWWCTQPIADRDGVLPVGYCYPNPMMAESYNSPCSPYWALKAFLPLALPESHPFWSAEEKRLPELSSEISIQREPGLLIHKLPDQSVALSAGQESQNFRHKDEKYAKFAYSTHFPFSVEARDVKLMSAALDGMLGVQAEGRPWSLRRSCLSAGIADDVVYTLWRPYDDTEIQTWLVSYLDGHLRLLASRTVQAFAGNRRYDRNSEYLKDVPVSVTVADRRLIWQVHQASSDSPLTDIIPLEL